MAGRLPREGGDGGGHEAQADGHGVRDPDEAGLDEACVRHDGRRARAVTGRGRGRVACRRDLGDVVLREDGELLVVRAGGREPENRLRASVVTQ